MGDVIKFPSKNPLDRIEAREKSDLYKLYTQLSDECRELILGSTLTAENKQLILNLHTLEKGLEIMKQPEMANYDHLANMQSQFERIKQQLSKK